MSRIEHFSVGKRNPGHWDIVAGGERLFRIRGGPGAYCVHDEREGKGANDTRRDFKSLSGAMVYVCEELMYELIVAEGQEPTVIERWNVTNPAFR